MSEEKQENMTDAEPTESAPDENNAEQAPDTLDAVPDEVKESPAELKEGGPDPEEEPEEASDNGGLGPEEVQPEPETVQERPSAFKDPQDHDEPHIHDDMVYIKIFAVLVIMTLAEVAGVWLEMSDIITFLYVMGLAIAEAILIAGFFMHLKWDHPIMSKVALVPIFFVVVLLVGVGLTTPGSPGDDFLAWCGF